MNKTLLSIELKGIISSRIHLAKSQVHKDISKEVWKAIDSDKIAEEAMAKILEVLELWLYLPCCHTSGMHNPSHFSEREYICSEQKAETLERFCHDLGVNPTTKSTPDCSWCRDYPHYRKGEGLPLFTKEKEEVAK